jgi:hypothetical protein
MCRGFSQTFTGGKQMLELTLKAKDEKGNPIKKVIDIGDGKHFALEKHGIRYFDDGLELVFITCWDEVESLKLDLKVSDYQKRYAEAYKTVNSDRAPQRGHTPLEQAKAALDLQRARASVNGAT